MSNSIMVTMFPAKDGDSFLFETPNFKMLIDGGYPETYQNFLKSKLKLMASQSQTLNLLIVTHIDEDHISGIQQLLIENGQSSSPQIIPINEIWYNSYRHLPKPTSLERKLTDEEREILENYLGRSRVQSFSGNEDISGKQGMTLAYYLSHNGYNWNRLSNNKAICTENIIGTKLTDPIYIRVVSPSIGQLEKLLIAWKKELNSKRWSFSLTDDSLFNMAMEAFLLSSNYEMDIVDENISYQVKANLTIDYLLSIVAKSDPSETNGASIAFIIEAYDKKLLFLGDAHENQIIREIENFIKAENYVPYFDLIKVSHHASLKNAMKLYDLIDGRIFLISTDGTRHNHPDLSAIARIICRPTNRKRTLVFNYLNEGYNYFDNNDLKQRYNYDVVLNTSGDPITL